MSVAGFICPGDGTADMMPSKGIVRKGVRVRIPPRALELLALWADGSSGWSSSAIRSCHGSRAMRRRCFRPGPCWGNRHGQCSDCDHNSYQVILSIRPTRLEPTVDMACSHSVTICGLFGQMCVDYGGSDARTPLAVARDGLRRNGGRRPASAFPGPERAPVGHALRRTARPVTSG